MNLQENENIVKIRGDAILEKPLEMGKTYVCQAEMTVRSIEEVDNDNGTKDKVHKAKISGLVAIKAEKEAPIVAVSKDKYKQSQLTRWAIEQYHMKHYGEPSYEFIAEDSEVFYQSVQKLFRGKLENIIRLLFDN